jgi:hypothetical protein
MKRLTFLLVLAFFCMVGCQRSAQFQRDQEYYQGDPGSYYNRPANKTITERIESMGQPKKRLVVLDFWNDTPVKSEALGKFAADELRRGLYQTQRIILPKEVKTEATTADFVEGDKVRVAQLVAEGRKLGVSTIVIGRLTKSIFRSRGDDVGLFRQKQALAGVDVEIKLFDVQSGRELMASGKSGEASANSVIAFESESLEGAKYREELLQLALRKAVGLLIPEVVRSMEKLTWEGTIAKISAGKVYLNAGRASGLVSGDILKVMTVGDDIYDPTSGAFLGKTPGQLKGTLEVVDFLGTDGAVADVHTGSGFQEGDVVQLY